jgi:hypothetical protein
MIADPSAANVPRKDSRSGSVASNARSNAERNAAFGSVRVLLRRMAGIRLAHGSFGTRGFCVGTTLATFRVELGDLSEKTCHAVRSWDAACRLRRPWTLLA